MVRTLLEGRKTQTRRVVKGVDLANCIPFDGKRIVTHVTSDGALAKCPYGQIGDRLWVRESFYCDHSSAGDYESTSGSCHPPMSREACEYEWRSMLYYGESRDSWKNAEWDGDTPPLAPSIHMPRWASRLTLTITGVRVERVQDISGDDALAEGVQIPVSAPNRPLLCLTSRISFESVSTKHPKEWGRDEYARFEYAQLWNTINGAGSWESNPWVWVLTFERAP